MQTHPLVAIARLFLFVREIGGANCGLWVTLFQTYTGNKNGDSWCASFVCFCLGILYKGKSPLDKSASCDVLLEQCRKKGYIVTTPQPGDLCFSMASANDAHHIAIVTTFAGPQYLATIAGNTSADGISNNGDRVAEHVVSTNKKVYARLPLAA